MTSDRQTNNRQPANNRQRLVIRISNDSLSFSTTEGAEVTYEPYPLNSSISVAANLREALRSAKLPGRDYARTLVMVDAPVLMIPANLFREEEQESLYRYTFTMTDQQTTMRTVVPDLNAVAVYAVSKDLRTVVTDSFRDVRFTAASASVWCHLHERSYTGQREKLYAYFHGQRLDIFSFVQNRFRFYNSYHAIHADDTLFYLLAVWKQLSMSAEDDELYLAGTFSEYAKLLDKLQTFVKRVFHINPAGEFNRAPITQIADIPYDLITLYMKGR